MTHDAVYLLSAHLTILITTVAGFVFSWLREGRRHRWQVEQNAQMRAAVRAVEAEVKNGHAS